jgi:hypothetical protein
MAENTTTLRITPRLIVGLSILIAGIAFTLDNFEILDASYILDLWPLVLVAVGLAKLGNARQTGAWISGTVWIVVGAWWIAYNLGFIDIHPFDLWPLLLIFAGAMLVRRAVFPKARPEFEGDSEHKVTGVACLSGVRRQITSNHFEGGDLTAVMGGCEVDLSRADIGSEPALLDVFAFWGGIDVRVPRNWTVQTEVTAILGGLSDRTLQDEADPDKVLVLRGIAIMGGVEIKN